MEFALAIDLGMNNIGQFVNLMNHEIFVISVYWNKEDFDAIFIFDAMNKHVLCTSISKRTK